ncbi:hypothetical protein Tco_1400871 [Tanacetum coccineum]
MAAYQVPPSPDYIPGPEEPQSPPLLDFIHTGIMYLESYQRRSRRDDEDPEEDPADYLADRDADDEDEDEDEEEEKHTASADSVPPVHRMTTRISIRDEPSISLPPMEEVERHLILKHPPPPPSITTYTTIISITTYTSPPFPASPPASVLPASSPLQLLSSDHRTDKPSTEIGESFSLSAATRPLGVVGHDYELFRTRIPRSDDREPRRSSMGNRDGTELTTDPGAGHTGYSIAVIGDTQDMQPKYIIENMAFTFGGNGSAGSDFTVAGSSP